jgi:putative membrane-bound dehydrogenase-like protein
MPTPFVAPFRLLPAALAAAILALPAAAQQHGRDAALAQLQKAAVPDGLEARLFALEPQVVNPASMDVDHRGRVWVTEGANYRLFQKWGKLRPEGDRIQVFEDTDGDGSADKVTTFYQGNEINTALGLCVLGDQVIVSCSPNIFVFEDKNGDLKADGPPRKLFTGIKGVDHDHGAHAFMAGPDGKLYFNVGNDGAQLMKADGSGYVVDRAGHEVRQHRQPYQQGLVFRCNPDGSGLETLGWNFRNNYEVAADSFGTIWQSDNDDDGNQGVRINYVMEYGNYGYRDEMTGAGWGDKRTNWEDEIPRRHWHLNDPGVVPNLLLTGAGSPTGLCIYEGDLLPAVFRNQIIHCDAGPRVVRAYPVENDGAGYQATIANLMTSEDTWFRPSDVAVGPDGAVYIADWNDAGVGGHYMADQKLETMTGRIYRVAPKGHVAKVPAYDFKSAAGAATALKSPNLEARWLAWQALHGMGAAAEPELMKVWADANPRFRARALHLLARIPGKEAQYVAVALKDANPDLRITGLRIARERGQDVIPLVKQLAGDASPQVRREAALALRHSKSPDAPALWTALAKQHDGRDRWYLEALGIAADRQWDAFLGAYLAAVPDALKTPAGRDIVWRSRAKQTPALLAKILKDPATAEAEKPRYFRAFDFQTGPEKDAALVELLTASVK